MSKFQPKRKLTLEYLLSNKLPVYVRHNALQANLLLLLEMKDKHGSSQPVHLHPTDMPVCLSDQFSAATLESSEQLRDLLRKEVIVLMDPKEAEEIISTHFPDVQAISVSAYSDSAKPNAAREGLQKLKEETEFGAIVASHDVGNDLSSEDAITPKIQTIMASFETQEKNAKETLSDLKKAKHIMTETDMNYILSKCKKDKNILEFIESLRAEA